MPIFAYEAVDNKGKKLRDEIEAPSKEDAVNQIQNMGYFPSNVREKGKGAGPSARIGASGRMKKGSSFGGGVSPANVGLGFSVDGMVGARFYVGK